MIKIAGSLGECVFSVVSLHEYVFTRLTTIDELMSEFIHEIDWVERRNISKVTRRRQKKDPFLHNLFYI